MANTGLHGPYKLDEWTIDRVVTRKSPGAYALGASDTAARTMACDIK